MSTQFLVFIVVAATAGAAIAWLLLRPKAATLVTRLMERDRESGVLRSSLEARDASLAAVTQERDRLAGTIAAERIVATEKLALLSEAEQRLRDTFAATSALALQQNNQAFLDLATARFDALQRAAASEFDTKQQSIEAIVQPVHQGIVQLSTSLIAFDRDRACGHAALEAQVRSMVEVQGKLAGETQALGRALRTPQSRGQWGELQLRKVVEIAGMERHCDFVEQRTIEGDEGRLRPDLLVRLSGHKSVVVDSKVPLSAYLDAMEATEGSTRDAFLDQHARQVRDHVTALAAKDYARELAEAPDFVVLFLAGEAFFSAALSRDPGLLEFAVSKGVILASPTILIAVLKGVAYGWQQERIAENAEAIRDAGRTLYDRIQTVAGHFEKLRKGLEGAVSAYNSAIGSIEGRVLPAARKLRALDTGAGDEIATSEPVDGVPRRLLAAELSHVDVSDSQLEAKGTSLIEVRSNTRANAA